MPRTVRPLSDAAIRAAKPRAKPFRLFDGLGLYIEVHPSGAKLWRMKYRFDGKEKRLAFGAWPEVSLAQARARRADARRILAEGIDPGQARRRAAPSFDAVAREWIGRHLAPKAEKHRVSVARRLERDVLPFLGDRPVDEITAPEVLDVVRRIEARGALETAHRALRT